MIQTIVVAVMVLASAAVVELNLDALASPLKIALPGGASQTLSVLQLVVGAGGALVVGWLAGQVDRAILGRRVRSREVELHAAQHDVARMKAETYDRQTTLTDVSLKNIHKRLEGIEQRLDRLPVPVGSDESRAHRAALTG